jgi:hypothetical protein
MATRPHDEATAGAAPACPACGLPTEVPPPQYEHPGWILRWEFRDDTDDLLAVAGQRGHDRGQRVTVYIRVDNDGGVAENFVWLRPEQARVVARALLAGADYADGTEVPR